MINAATVYRAKTYVTRIDDYVLLQLHTSDGEQWFRLYREDFIEFANYVSNDAKQMKGRN